jgi:hypothetical protein
MKRGVTHSAYTTTMHLVLYKVKRSTHTSSTTDSNCIIFYTWTQCGTVRGQQCLLDPFLTLKKCGFTIEHSTEDLETISRLPQIRIFSLSSQQPCLTIEANITVLNPNYHKIWTEQHEGKTTR